MISSSPASSGMLLTTTLLALVSVSSVGSSIHRICSPLLQFRERGGTVQFLHIFALGIMGRQYLGIMGFFPTFSPTGRHSFKRAQKRQILTKVYDIYGFYYLFKNTTLCFPGGKRPRNRYFTEPPSLTIVPLAASSMRKILKDVRGVPALPMDIDRKIMEILP